MDDQSSRLDLRQWSRQALPWTAVVLGSAAVFSYAFLDEFPLAFKQSAGQEILLFGIQEAGFRIAISILLGRLIVLALREPIFSLLRLFLLQIPLQVMKIIGIARRKYIQRLFIFGRRLLDTFYVFSIKYPGEIALVISAIIFVYLSNNNWREVGAAIMVILIILFSPKYVESNAKTGLRLRFRYPKQLQELNNLRGLAHSTCLLLLAFIAGTSEARHLLNTIQPASIEGKTVNVVYFAKEHILARTVDGHEQIQWLILPYPGTGIRIE